MTNFAEKIVGKYSGLAGIVYNAVKLLAPTFVAQFTTFLVGIINQFTDWLASIGPWGIVIKLVLILFSAIAAVIIANIIWAGSNHKGFRMGLEWTGLFRTRWVYDFYD